MGLAPVAGPGFLEWHSGGEGHHFARNDKTKASKNIPVDPIVEQAIC